MDVKASQIISVSYVPVQQVSTIHYMCYVSREQHGKYVSRIKQDHMPLESSMMHP
jgi:hypothetical protein